jgi:hypothetical protein
MMLPGNATARVKSTFIFIFKDKIILINLPAISVAQYRDVIKPAIVISSGNCLIV